MLFIFQRDISNDVTFHFYGAKQDSDRINEAIHKMVERGRVGNISLIQTELLLKREAALQILVRKKKI